MPQAGPKRGGARRAGGTPTEAAIPLGNCLAREYFAESGVFFGTDERLGSFDKMPELRVGCPGSRSRVVSEPWSTAYRRCPLHRLG